MTESTTDRRERLAQLRSTIAGAESKNDLIGHGMMIVGQEGGMLQIYNPWGTTTWVSEEDFVKGDLSAASDDRFTNVNHVYVEQD